MSKAGFVAFAKIAMPAEIVSKGTQLLKNTASKSFQAIKQPNATALKSALEGQNRNFTLKKMVSGNGIKPIEISSSKRIPVRPVRVVSRARSVGR